MLRAPRRGRERYVTSLLLSYKTSRMFCWANRFDEYTTTRAGPLCLSCLREFRGLGHAVGSRFTLLESKGNSCSISQRTAVRRRAVLSFPTTVCTRARASSLKTRARAGAPRDGIGFFARSSVRDKYVALNGARRTDDMNNETRTTGGARKDIRPPFGGILLFSRYIIVVAMRSRCRAVVSLFLLLSLHTTQFLPSTSSSLEDTGVSGRARTLIF